jgi:protein TonB
MSRLTHPSLLALAVCPVMLFQISCGYDESPVIPPEPLVPCSYADTSGTNQSSIDELPILTRAWPPPEYPEIAREQGATGLVLLSITVGRSGHACNVRVRHSSTIPELGEAAIEAVLQWEFKPAMTDGTPVPARIQLPIRFGSG